jgi:undecaprenyl-diphosphatase
MILFALLLGVAESRSAVKRGMGTITVADGLVVGIGQALALIPGASRSGATLTAAMFLGLERATAARFSFLLSLPAVFLAGVYELFKYRQQIAESQMARPFLIATVIAFFVGWATIAWLLKFLRTRPTYIFIVYRIILGAIILGLLASHRLV